MINLININKKPYMFLVSVKKCVFGVDFLAGVGFKMFCFFLHAKAHRSKGFIVLNHIET
jgi:hypothetical protein